MEATSPPPHAARPSSIHRYQDFHYSAALGPKEACFCGIPFISATNFPCHSHGHGHGYGHDHGGTVHNTIYDQPDRFTLSSKQLTPVSLPLVRADQYNMTQQPIRLWGGRFTGASDPIMDQYNESLSFDRVFYAQDIRGSIAYARANVKTGILTQEEFDKIEEGLKAVLNEWEHGKFTVAPGDEGESTPSRTLRDFMANVLDIHTANERRLGEVIGTHIAGKLHTGMSICYTSGKSPNQQLINCRTKPKRPGCHRYANVAAR